MAASCGPGLTASSCASAALETLPTKLTHARPAPASRPAPVGERAADTSSPATRSRSGKSAAPALPAAARRRPCPPGGTLAVRPRPETESRVGLLPVAVAHRDEPAQRPDVRRAVGPDSDRGPVVVVAEARAGEHPVDRLAGAEVDGGEVVRVGPPRGARQLRVEI